MIKPFEWHHCLLYGDKKREEYTMEEKGTLDEFLYRMYMVAHDCDGLFMSNAVKALNAAYYLAVALYNTPHVEEVNHIDVLVKEKVSEILQEEHHMYDQWKISLADLSLVEWMALAILKLQREKPAGMDVFLDKFQQQISWNGDFFGYDDGEIGEKCRFLLEFPKMIEQMGDERFDSDLRPDAAFPSDIPDFVWTYIGLLGLEDIELLLRNYRTEVDQLAFLDYCRKGESWYVPPFSSEKE